MFEAEPITGAHFEPNLLIEFLRPPFRRFEILTPMSPAHAAAELQKIVEPSKTFRWPYSKGHLYFEGTVEGERFSISRIIGYRNSFLPRIEGRFRIDGSRTITILTMRMAWPVMVVWLGLMGSLLLPFVGASRVSGLHTARSFFIKMILFVYVLATVSFAIEVRIAMKRLLELLRPGSFTADRG
jgi:hypothetical protein